MKILFMLFTYLLIFQSVADAKTPINRHKIRKPATYEKCKAAVEVASNSMSKCSTGRCGIAAYTSAESVCVGSFAEEKKIMEKKVGEMCSNFATDKEEGGSAQGLVRNYCLL